MAEFNIRGDGVDVEQIMRQIRARIREKRGVDYTEQEIQEMANVKLEKFLDPQGVRSDLVAQFRQARHETEPLNFAFEDTTLFESHRAILRWIRKLLRPILKLLFNPAPIAHALNVQARLNTARHELDPLYYEVIHNLVLEMTRLSIETKNLKMRLESVSSRLEFNERRARALEGVVQYRATTGASEPIAQPSRSVQESAPPAAGASSQAPGLPAEGPGQRSRRRRRRRGRRGGAGQPERGGEAGGGSSSPADEGDAGPDEGHEAGEGPQTSAGRDRAESGSHDRDAEAGDFES